VVSAGDPFRQVGAEDLGDPPGTHQAYGCVVDSQQESIDAHAQKAGGLGFDETTQV
jgi:hypothetical protein